MVERQPESSTALRYLYLTIDPQGRRQEVARTALSTRRTLQYLPSTAIFVDTVPFADTVRTGGFGLGVYRDVNSYDVPEPWLGGVIDFNRGIPNDKYFTRALKLGLFHSEAAASELVSRMILFGRGPSGVQFVSQCAKGNDGICLLPGNATSPPVRLFELEGAAFSMLRKVFASNNDTMTVNSYNDAFGIIKGDSTVVVLGGAVQPTRLTKTVPELAELDAAEADRFLAQYQATHRE